MSERAERGVRIAAGPVSLAGDLVRPEGADGLVLFAHGSGSSRKSPRNRYVAGVLQDAGFATLLMDLLTMDEEHAERAGARRRFDIDLLAGRLAGATDWVMTHPDTAGLPIGYFGASTGAAAALVAAAQRPKTSRRWSRAAGGPISPALRCAGSRPRRSSSSGVSTTS